MKLNNFIKKHAKKILPLLFVAPANASAQNLSIGPDELITNEILDTVTTNPKYDPHLKPYIAETYRDLPEMTAGQSIINPHKTYVGYFDEHGELQVIRTDCRYSAAAPDMLIGVFRVECDHYTKNLLEKRHIENKVPAGFTTDEYYAYLKSPNNTLGELIRNYCNFRKKYVGARANRRNIVVRAGFFQGGINEWTACLRAAYCSPDENVKNFASNFIADTKENLAIRDSVIKVVYDKNGEFISGEEGVKKRIKVSPLLKKITIESIGGKVDGHNCLNNKLCNLLLYYTKKQKFKNENEEFQYQKMANAVKKMQEDYVLAWYPLAGKTTMIAKNADIYVAYQVNEKIKSKTNLRVTSKQVKERGFGINAEPGILLGLLESSINGGPYFDGYAKNNNSNGFYPDTKKLLGSFIIPFNKNKLLTQEFLRQAAILGISGALQAYETFTNKKNILQKEEQDIIDKLQKNKLKPVAPQDRTILSWPKQINVAPKMLRPLKLPKQSEK